MENPAVSQQLKSPLLWTAGLLLAVFLGSQIGSENYMSILFGTAITVLASVALFAGRFFWVITIASSFLGGTFPILRAAFTPFQILIAIGVAKFLVEDIALRRTPPQTRARFDLFMVGGFMAVVTLHALRDRFGMRFLGSSVWGGHNYVNVYVGLAAFFVIQSIPMKPKLWSKLPYVVLGVATFDLLIAVITTVFPSSIYVIFPFYSAVSNAGIEEILTGNPVETARVGGFGNFGFILITLVLASVSLRQILNPSNFFRLMTLFVGGVAVLYSSFRSAVFNTLGVTLAAGIRDLKFKALALTPLLVMFLFGLSVLNSEFIRLPKQMQRSLAFIPGKWDLEMQNDARASNEFRRRVWATWRQEFFPLHPWLGRGFGFSSKWAERSMYKPKAVDYRQTVEVGDVHNGLFASLDAIGLVGTVFFVIWNLALLARAVRVPFLKNDPDGRALRFLALYLATSILCYWMGAQNLGSFLPQEFALASVFLRLRLAAKSAVTASKALPTRDIVVGNELAVA